MKHMDAKAGTGFGPGLFPFLKKLEICKDICCILLYK